MIFEPISQGEQAVVRFASLSANLVSLPAVQWLNRRPKAQVLHVFDRSVNLLAEDGHILSLTTPEIAPGPFSIVVKGKAESRHLLNWHFDGLATTTSVVVGDGGLQIGPLRIDTEWAEYWDPRIDPGLLGRQSLSGGIGLLRSLMERRAPADSLLLALSHEEGSLFHQRVRQAWTFLRQGVLSQDPELCAEGARQAAGVGIGLTPAGDDFLVGVLVGLWSTSTDAERCVEGIVASATPRTSKLSAAWIAAAGRREVSQVWHDLIMALLNRDQGCIADAGRRALGAGHTSGLDALSGFVAILDLVNDSRQTG